MLSHHCLRQSCAGGPTALRSCKMLHPLVDLDTVWTYVPGPSLGLGKLTAHRQLSIAYTCKQCCLNITVQVRSLDKPMGACAEACKQDKTKQKCPLLLSCCSYARELIVRMRQASF